MLLTFIGLVIFSVVFVFIVSNTRYHILCTSCNRVKMVLYPKSVNCMSTRLGKFCKKVMRRENSPDIKVYNVAIHKLPNFKACQVILCYSDGLIIIWGPDELSKFSFRWAVKPVIQYTKGLS